MLAKRKQGYKQWITAGILVLAGILFFVTPGVPDDLIVLAGLGVAKTIGIL
jgi:hypothetical protein